MMVHLTDQNFVEEVIQSSRPVLVDCWTLRCEACRFNAPVADEIASAYKDKIKVGKLNVDDNPWIISQFDIKLVPAMILFNKGNTIHKFWGNVRKEDIVSIMTTGGLL